MKKLSAILVLLFIILTQLGASTTYFVPDSRTVNGKRLNANITLNQDDIGDGTTYKQVSSSEKFIWNSKLSPSLYDANSLLIAILDDTPVKLEVTEETVIGRVTGGNIAALTLGVAAGNVAKLPADPGANTVLGFDNTTNTYKPFAIGTGLAYDQPTATLSSTGSGVTAHSDLTELDYASSGHTDFQYTSFANIAEFGAIGDSNTSTAADNTTYIQAALDSGAKDIYIPKGTSGTGIFYCGPLNIPSTVKRIHGPGHLKSYSAAFVNSAFLNIMSHPGPLALEGFTIELDNALYGDNNININVYASDSVTMSRLNIIGGYYGIYGNSATHLIITKNTKISGWYTTSVLFNACSNSEVSHSQLLDTAPGTAEAFNVYGGTNVNLIHSYVSAGAAAEGFATHWSLTSKSRCEDNRIRNSSQELVAGTSNTDFQIINNDLEGVAGVHYDNGISIGGSSGTHDNSTIVKGNHLVGIGANGILAGDFAIDMIVDFNTVDNAGTWGPAAPAGTVHCNGIAVYPDAQNTIITRNILRNTGASTSMRYGIREITKSELGYGTNEAKGTFVDGNIIVKATVGDVLLTGTTPYEAMTHTMSGTGTSAITNADTLRGPSSATDNNFAIFDGATGGLVKDSGVNFASFFTTTYNIGANKSLNTVYRNTTGKPLFLIISVCASSGGDTLILYGDAANPPTIQSGFWQAPANNHCGTLTSVVGVNEYYKAVPGASVGLGGWVEKY